MASLLTAHLTRERNPRGRSRKGAPPGEPRRVAYLYIGPALLLVALFVLIPLIRTIQISFLRWDGITPARPVGFDNYLEILTDPALLALFGHSAVLVAFYSVLPITIGLLITALLSRRPVRGMVVYRTIYFLPQAVSLVVIAVAWQWVYSANGVANQFLGRFGIRSNTAWLGDFTWALPAIGLIGSWLLTGLCMVLFLAGVQKIDHGLYEAARLDGANGWHEFWNVTFPGLRAELAVSFTLTVVAGLRSFDLIYLLTRGGPGTATSVPGYEIFARAFNRQQLGSAAALAVVLTILILMISLVINRLSNDKEES